MNKILYVILLSLYCMQAGAAEQKQVVLREKADGTAREIVEYGFGQVIFDLQKSDSKNNYDVTVTVRNTQKDTRLCLFGKTQSRNSLKKFRLSVGKNLGFNPETLPIGQDLGGDYVLNAGESFNIKIYSVSPMHVEALHLPFLIAKPKKQTKTDASSEYVIIASNTEYISVSVEPCAQSTPPFTPIQDSEIDEDTHVGPDDLMADSIYHSLVDKAETLIHDINETVFCKNPNHPVATGFEQLKERFKGRILRFRNEVNNFLGNYDIRSSEDYYKELVDNYLVRLEKIDFDARSVKKCQKDKKDSHATCVHCKLTYDKIYRQMSELYMSLRNKSKSKSKVLPIANGLMKCVRENKSRVLNVEKKRKIEDYYQRIKNYK